MFLFSPICGPSFPLEQKPKHRVVTCATGEHLILNVSSSLYLVFFLCTQVIFLSFPKNIHLQSTLSSFSFTAKDCFCGLLTIQIIM